MYPTRPRRQAGFTLVELVIVLVVLGILSVYAMMNNGHPSAYTLRSQADAMAHDLRHTQSLATTWGRSLRVSIVTGTGGTYSVSCVTAGTSPCNASPVVDPVTGQPFTVTIKQGASLDGPATLDFDSLGRPSAAALYSLAAGGSGTTISVAAVTGFVTVP